MLGLSQRQNRTKEIRNQLIHTETILCWEKRPGISKILSTVVDYIHQIIANFFTLICLSVSNYQRLSEQALFRQTQHADHPLANRWDLLRPLVEMSVHASACTRVGSLWFHYPMCFPNYYGLSKIKLKSKCRISSKLKSNLHGRELAVR